MRVVHIGYKYGRVGVGGAAIAATRLHLAFLEAGVESYYVCVHQCEPGQNIYQLPCGFSRKLYLIATKVLRNVWKFTPFRRAVFMNVVPLFGLERLLREIKPDVVHVHWIVADVCSFEQLARLPYKLVFHLHDLWILNALSPHPGSDERFMVGFDLGNSNFLERWMFDRKRRLINREVANPSQRTMFLGPSNWTKTMCERSIIGKNMPVRVCPNIIDTAFRYDPKLLKPHKNFTVLFGGYGGRSNSFKGWNDLVAALALMQSRTLSLSPSERPVLWVVGETFPEYDLYGVRVHSLGPVNDLDTMRKIYHEVDVLAFPSKLETQGMMKVEALLCGLPVIAFDRTACAEGIEHGVTGWVAPNNDFAAYVVGLEHFFVAWESGEISALREAIAAFAADRYHADALISEVFRSYSV